MDALEAILTRRSTRRLKSELPKKELIEQVIEAGRCAPSGGNSQSTHFVVITKDEVLARLAELVQAEFAKMELRDDLYGSLKYSISAAKKGGYVFHYNAPLLIVTANKKEYGNALADSACALENMMIAANALGLGACWINQLHWLDENAVVREYLETIGIPAEETVTGGLILGYPAEDMQAKEPVKRTGNPVTWI